ncbi:unnamed protein product [Eruca vesicaria subsp. sativa]|uniref:Uncharacterized protein n=1 Tax=Eruca vesicaria subsp. sativa TaxID=29727 RepID=A0ABC8LBR3_ERUVS|nr:unnamed protein product [Eruca vesicaria subsp. sativa]
MDQRTGDPRIYIVTLLFLSCILTGGVLLGLYLIQHDPNPLFLEAGMFFVGIPWVFWFLAYLYSCLLKPCIIFCLSKSVSTFDDPEKGKDEEEKNNKSITEIAMSDSHPVAAVEVEPRSSPGDGEKHVQFGNVVVLGDEGRGKPEEEDRNERSTNKLIPDHMRMGDEDNQEHGMLNSRSDDDDKTPLRLSVGNK